MLLFITVGLNAQRSCLDLSGKIVPCKEDTIKIPFHAAKQIAKDLVIGDSAKSVLIQIQKELDLTIEASTQKDTVIANYKIKDSLYEDRLIKKDVKFNIEKIYADRLQQQNTILKRIAKGITLGASVVIGLLILLK